MRDRAKHSPPQLSLVQLAWMQEIGIDKRLLLRFKNDSQPRLKKTVHAIEELRSKPSVPKLAPAPRPTPALSAPIAPVMSAALLAHDLVSLQAQVATCEACSLHAGRSQTVFGMGAAQSVAWLIVGEAPGDRDDRLGLPFQGKAGELLRAMLATVGIDESSAVYFTNVIKCRPRSNRAPTHDEIAACMPHLQRQISLLKPQRILVLGWMAARALLGEEASLEQLRGRIHTFTTETGASIPMVATYHPASLLSRPGHKGNAWRDLMLARRAALV